MVTDTYSGQFLTLHIQNYKLLLFFSFLIKKLYNTCKKFIHKYINYYHCIYAIQSKNEILSQGKNIILYHRIVMRLPFKSTWNSPKRK